MNTPALTRLFGFDAHTAGQNVAGLTHEESLVSPSKGGNCANWVLGHIVASRQMLFGMIGLAPFWAEERMRIYGRGAPPLKDPSKATPFPELVRIHGETTKTLMDFLAKAKPETLSRPLAEPSELLGQTVGDALTAFAWHEGYHAGQLGLLRRVAGKPGALA